MSFLAIASLGVSDQIQDAKGQPAGLGSVSFLSGAGQQASIPLDMDQQCTLFIGDLARTATEVLATFPSTS